MQNISGQVHTNLLVGVTFEEWGWDFKGGAVGKLLVILYLSLFLENFTKYKYSNSYGANRTKPLNVYLVVNVKKVWALVKAPALWDCVGLISKCAEQKRKVQAKVLI